MLLVFIIIIRVQRDVINYGNWKITFSKNAKTVRKVGNFSQVSNNKETFKSSLKYEININYSKPVKNQWSRGD